MLLPSSESSGITYPSGSDPNGAISVRYGLLGIPTTFVVGADGRLRYEVLGRVDPQALRRALDHLLTGNDAG